MRIAIISDIHEDRRNLGLALRKIKKLKCDKVICLGDISGFSPPFYDFLDTRNAHECLQMVQEFCDINIAGNHDLHAAMKVPSISPLFDYPENWFELDYHERLKITDGKIWLYLNDELNPLYTNADIELLKTLPEYVSFEADGNNMLFSHYLYPNLCGDHKKFVDKEDDDYLGHFNFMNQNNCQLAFVGHAHYPGLAITTTGRRIRKGYKSQIVNNLPSIIFVPPITRGRDRSGFTIFETDTRLLEAISI